jgi:RNA polymerase sigma factor (sigma-70 family)
MDILAERAQCGLGTMAASRGDRVTEREAEFAALVERNARRMFRVAYSLLRNAHDAEDAVQEAFLKLDRTDGWHRMEDERAFLARTVWRVALTRLGRLPTARETEDAAEMEIGANSATPEEWAAMGNARELLRQMIDRLPEELRRVVVLSAIEEMTLSACCSPPVRRGNGIGPGDGPGIGPGSGGNKGGGVRHVGGSVSRPKVIYMVEPEFSDEARRAKFSGDVDVYLWVDEHGNPTHGRVARGVGMGLDERAVDAVKRYRFRPAMENGKPVAVEMYVVVNFHIF